MEIGQIGATNLFGSGLQRPAESGLGDQAVRPQEDVLQEVPKSQRRALTILTQEIRQVLAKSFRFSMGALGSSFGSELVTAAGVAADALAAGRALVDDAPLAGTSTLAKLRQRIEGASNETREIVDADDDDDLDDALARINAGFDELDDDASRNVESSASFLSYESRLRQRSTIRIRTQEGDIVRLDLRRMERMSATDVAITDGNASFSSTEVALSSRSRMMLSVNGDLNEAEFAAIQNVFAQAEAVAEEFYGGDLAAAFDRMSGIEFDSEQLARVNMRFREKLVTNFSFASIGVVRPEPVAVAAPEPAALPESRSAPTIPEVVEVPLAIVEPETATAVETPEPTNVAVDPDPVSGAIEGFFDLLADFLKILNEGFEDGSFRFFYSESFKLEILKSVLQFTAPEESGTAADKAGTLIDQIDAGEETGQTV